MIGRAAIVLGTALSVGPTIATAGQSAIGGVAIGMPIAEATAALGPPLDVASVDSGHRFVFAGGIIAYADDDGRVLAVESRCGSPRIDIDGQSQSLPIGTYSLGRADAELAEVAEFSTPRARSFRLAPRRDLVLDFSASNVLERVAYGEPGQLARLGDLPGDAAAKALPFRAPVPRRALPAPGGTGARTTLYRLEIDRRGAVSGVDVISSSARAGDADADADASIRRLSAERYVPATLGGRPIAATIFVQVRD